jgi:DNA-binding transcriptional MerR regulator
VRVKQLATSLGVTPDTVRYYTREEYLHPVKDAINGYKEYTAADRTRLRFILSARQLGFSVTDIGQILAQADKGKTPCPVVRTLIAQRLRDIEERYRDMTILRDRMASAVDDWNTRPDRAPTGHMICHLIESFAG